MYLMDLSQFCQKDGKSQTTLLYFVSILSFFYLARFQGELWMLIISRKKGEKIILGNNIEITILDVGRTRVRFGIEAPREISIRSQLKEPEPAAEAVASSSETEPARQSAASIGSVTP